MRTYESYIVTLRLQVEWEGHSNPNCGNQKNLNFPHSQMVGTQKTISLVPEPPGETSTNYCYLHEDSILFGTIRKVCEGFSVLNSFQNFRFLYLSVLYVALILRVCNSCFGFTALNPPHPTHVSLSPSCIKSKCLGQLYSN